MRSASGEREEIMWNEMKRWMVIGVFQCVCIDLSFALFSIIIKYYAVLLCDQRSSTSALVLESWAWKRVGRENLRRRRNMRRDSEQQEANLSFHAESSESTTSFDCPSRQATRYMLDCIRHCSSSSKKEKREWAWKIAWSRNFSFFSI